MSIALNRIYLTQVGSLPNPVRVKVLWKGKEGFPEFGYYRIVPLPGQGVTMGECFAAREEDLTCCHCRACRADENAPEA